MPKDHPRYVLYLAVLPAYRTACMHEVVSRLHADVALFASPAHLDQSVTSGIERSLYTDVAMCRLGGKAFLQLGHWREAIGAATTILDLNPRSISAWALLVIRKLMGRRTLLWGHLHGQAGPDSRTAGLRHQMRALGDGFVAYTYTTGEIARTELPDQNVGVAPNSLFSIEQLSTEAGMSDRNDVVYVGRFEAAKKVQVGVEAFADVHRIQPKVRLVLVGGGADEPQLRALVSRLGLEDSVVFRGWINDVDELRTIYSSAFCSLATGFIGLGVTQSLGFGVPQLASRDEPHSPEVELASTGGVTYFKTDDPHDLAARILEAFEGRNVLPNAAYVREVKERYSTDTMAEGIESALRGVI